LLAIVPSHWGRILANRETSKSREVFGDVQKSISAVTDRTDKASKAGSFVGRSAGYAITAGATGVAGVVPLFFGSLDNTIDNMESQGYDIHTSEAMLRGFGTAAVEVGSEYLFNVLEGFGSIGSAVMARSSVGSTVLSKVTGVFGSTTAKATSAFNKFIASTPNPTMSKYLLFLAKKGNEEGLEELASYIGSGIIQLWTTDQDAKISDVLNAKDALTNYSLGAVMGFAISGITNVPSFSDVMPSRSLHKSAMITSFYRCSSQDVVVVPSSVASVVLTLYVVVAGSTIKSFNAACIISKLFNSLASNAAESVLV